MSFDKLREMLMKHEGLRLKPYLCPAGRMTIGYGRNLDDVGINKAEAYVLLNNDIDRTINQVNAAFSWFSFLNPVRQDVVASMVFNMGLSKFKEFKKMISAIEAGNFAKAADEMKASKWAVQVGLRAVELAKMMELGVYL